MWLIKFLLEVFIFEYLLIKWGKQFFHWIQKTQIFQTMLREDFNASLFRVTFSNLTQQIFQKQIQVSRLEMDLIRKCQGKSHCISQHLEVIKNCRKTVGTLDGFIKDVKTHFNELKILEIYTFFEALFRMLVFILKIMSECYLNRFENHRGRSRLTQYAPKQQNKEPHPQSISQQQQLYNLRKQNSKKLEYIDSIIAGIQDREMELKSQMHFLISDLDDERQKISKIDVTIKHDVFEEMSKLFEDISHRAEYLFNNFFKGTYAELKRNFDYMKPEDVQKQIISEMRKDIRELARTRFEGFVRIVEDIFRQKMKRNIEKKEIQFEKVTKSLKKEKEQLLKTHMSKKGEKKGKKASVSKKKDQEISIEEQIQDEKLAAKKKEAEQLTKDVELLKKQNKLLNNEVEDLKQTLKKQKVQISKIEFQNRELEKLYKKKTIELEESKAELQWAIQKSIRESLVISLKKSQLEESIKANRNRYLKKEVETAEDAVQTDIWQIIEPDQLFANTLNFDHKALIGKSKNRRMGSELFAQNKDKKRIAEMEDILKLTLEQMNKFMLKELKISEKLAASKKTIEAMINDGKYNEALQKMKERIKTSEGESKNEQEDVKQMTHKKQKSKFQSNKLTKRSSINEERKLIDIATQTDKNMHRRRDAIVRNIRSSLSGSKMIAVNETVDKRMGLRENKLKTNFNRPSELITKFNNSVLMKNQENGQDKGGDLIYRYRDPSFNNYMDFNQNTREDSKGKGKYLENSFFQHLNINTAEGNRFKRGYDMVMGYLHNSKNGQELNKSKSRKNIDIEDQQNRCSLQKNQFMDQLKMKGIRNIDEVMDEVKNMGYFQSNDEKSKEKYQQLLMNILFKMGCELGTQKVSEVIKKIKSSPFTTCENSTHNI